MEEMLSWQSLYGLNIDCETRYESVLKDLREGKFLPSAGLALLQHILQTVVRDTSIDMACDEEDGTEFSFLRMLESRFEGIKGRRLKVLITGEYNAGKSTFLNVLMGGSYLPVDRGKVTKVVCEIRHGPNRHATLVYADDTLERTRLALSERPLDESWEVIRHCIVTRTYEGNALDRIVLEWPLPALRELPTLSTAVSSDCRARQRHVSSAVPITTPGERHRADVAGSSFLEIGIGDPRLSTEDNIGSADSGFVVVTSNDRSKAHQETVEQKRGDKGDVENTVPKTVFSGDDTELGEEKYMYEKPEHDSDFEKEYSSSSTSSASSRSNQSQDFPRRNGSLSGLSEPGTSVSPTLVSGQMADLLVPVTFVDCPGIDEEDVSTSFSTVLSELNTCNSFIFITDTSDKAIGIRKKGVLQLISRMSCKLAERGMLFNTGATLFIANKIDDYDKEKAVKDSLEKLRQTLPMVGREQIITTSAKKVLKKIRKGKLELRNKIYSTLEVFLRKAYKATLEDHLTWLMKVTELATWIGGVDKLPFPAGLKAKLEQERATAVSVQTVTAEKAGMEDAHIEQTTKTIHKIFCEFKDDIHGMRLETCWLESIGAFHERYREDDRKAWEDTFNALHEIILKEIFNIEAVKNALNIVNAQYVKGMDEIYEKEIKVLKSLKTRFCGLQADDGVDVKTSPRHIINTVTPALISGTFRVSPIGVGAVLLLTSMLPIVWLLSAWFEEWTEHKYQVELEEFRRDKDAYVAKILRELIEVNSAKFAKASSFLEHSGKKKRRDIHEKAAELIRVIDNLLESSSTPTAAQRETVKQHYLTTFRLYMCHFLRDIDVQTWTSETGQQSPSASLGSLDSFLSIERGSADLEESVSGAREIRVRNEQTGTVGNISVQDCLILRAMSTTTAQRLTRLVLSEVSAENDFDVCCFAFPGSNLYLTSVITQTFADLNEQMQDFIHYARECCECLKTLHDLDLTHGNLSPANFVLNTRMEYEGQRYPLKISVLQNLGTVDRNTYTSPEVQEFPGYLTKSSDIYSLGLIFMELWFRQRIDGLRVIDNKFRIPQNQSVNKLMVLSLSKDPKKRENINRLLMEVQMLN